MVNEKFLNEYNTQVRTQTKLADHEDANISNHANNVLSVLSLIADRMLSGWYDEEDTFEHALEEAIDDMVEADQRA
jgi:hypothetical protein